MKSNIVIAAILGNMLCSWRIVASATATADEYNAANEGLTSINGNEMWPTALDFVGINTVNLSYNAFASTNIVTLDFREAPAVISDYEPGIHHLDLSHNQIVDASLAFFTLVDGPWHLITLDLSFNQITDLSNFPKNKNRGDLEVLNLEHNLISQLGSPHPDVLKAITQKAAGKPPIHVNLEYNQLTQMPWLGYTDSGGATDAVINIKNNKISLVELSNNCGGECGYWYLKVIDFTNNALEEFTFDMIDFNWDVVIYNFNNNKITQISAFTPSDPTYAEYAVRELYFDKNEITSVAQEAFIHFVHLEVLVLSNNRIPALRFDYIFADYRLGVLTTLNIENNELTSVMDRTVDFPADRTPVINMNIKGNV